MRSFAFDVGFDWNSTLSSSRHLPLFIGLVNITPAEHEPVGSGDIVYDDFAEGDSFEFNLFNLTNGAVLADYSVTAGSVLFRAAPIDGQTAPTPTHQQPEPVGSIGPAPQTGTSLIFRAGDPFPCWLNITGGTISNVGDFLFTVSVSVTGPDDVSKTFVVDPEMIVQATPPVDDPESRLEAAAVMR